MLRPEMRATDFLVAESKAMRAVAQQVDEYADGGAPVLICGEHGTGRELVARVLHQRGPRGTGRFVAVRPTFEGSDVPAVAGADACERARRALSAAAGGTLLVKDVSDLSAPSQRTLKRAIRDRKEPEAHDVHVVATADIDVDHAVDAQIVSRDFYDLFAPRRIEVPPLRDRIEDLPTLFERWVKHYSCEVGRTKPTVSSRAHERLSAYPWPGNVAELKSIARRLLVRVSPAAASRLATSTRCCRRSPRADLEDLAFRKWSGEAPACSRASMGIQCTTCTRRCSLASSARYSTSCLRTPAAIN